ncbi:MAG: hypothetical protein GW949_00600 [Spirochaetales bacterium]|nr:hypothetical protein [Spirochaetales bacterium]
MTLFPLEGQEGRLEGWRSFSLPGLPSEEQYILKALLDSRDSSVALTALAELKGGVESGRISTQSKEYIDFIGELVSATRVRSDQNPRGLERIFATNPRSLFILIDLVFPLPEEYYLNYLSSIMQTQGDPIILHYVLEKTASVSKRFSPELVVFVREELFAQGSGSRPIDPGFVRAVLGLLGNDFRQFRVYPDESLIEPLFLVRGRTRDSRLANEIYASLEEIYIFPNL